MIAKLTPWFPADVKPVHKGVYNTKAQWGRTEGAFQYWDGKKFKCTNYSAIGAYRDRRFSSFYPSATWRGLASNPAEATK